MTNSWTHPRSRLAHGEWARLSRIAYVPGHFSELYISLIAWGDLDEPSRYRLFCRRVSLEDERNWVRKVDAACIDRTLESLSRALVPALPPHASEADGVTTELVFSRGAHTIAYGWWNEAPEGYGVLAAFAEELERLAGGAG